jgi:hypothetical protein
MTENNVLSFVPKTVQYALLLAPRWMDPDKNQSLDTSSESVQDWSEPDWQTMFSQIESAMPFSDTSRQHCPAANTGSQRERGLLAMGVCV